MSIRPAPEGNVFDTERLSSSVILLLNDGKIAKLGRHICLHEADNMNFIRKHTSIPVPEVFDEYDTSDGRHCIIMSRIPGTTLQEAWPTLSDESRSSIVEQYSRAPTAKRRKCQLCIWFSNVNVYIWVRLGQSSALLIRISPSPYLSSVSPPQLTSKHPNLTLISFAVNSMTTLVFYSPMPIWQIEISSSKMEG